MNIKKKGLKEESLSPAGGGLGVVDHSQILPLTIFFPPQNSSLSIGQASRLSFCISDYDGRDARPKGGFFLNILILILLCVGILYIF